MALNTHKVNRSPGWCWVFLKQRRAWDWDLAFLGVEKEEELVKDAERPMKQREAERVATCMLAGASISRKSEGQGQMILIE